MSVESARPDLAPARVLSECDVRFTRSSGPGGQHRNKVETGVVIVHRPTRLRVTASERRSQAENRAVAARQLILTLALGVRRPQAPDGEPSPLWKSRCRGGKLLISHEHQDFPLVLAEALDAIEAHGYELGAASGWLGCTFSQLLKLLRSEPHALMLVNERRASRGLGELH
jgi:hypothetical protein